jgi:hypothetical protein
MYDIAPDPAPRAVAAVGTVLVPSEPVPGAPAAVGATHVPHGAAQLGYRRAEPTEGAVAEYFPDRVKDLYAPLWLIGGGTVVELVAAVIRYRGSPRGLSAGMTEVGITLVAGTVFMLVGILIAARVRGLDLGKFWTAVLKLAAISIAPGAVVTLASPALMLLPIIGALLGWGINFCLYFALIGMLFDLDESDTWFVVVVVFLVKVAVAIALIFGVLSQIRA